MSFTSINNIKIVGMAAAVPPDVISNEDYEYLTPAERKLLIKTIGVQQRYVDLSKTITTSDLCFDSAERLLKELDWDKQSIGGLIFLSQSRDYYLPATAIILQDRLGLSQNCMAFDMSLGCSGFVYGMQVVASMMAGGNIKRMLFLLGDNSSITSNPKDKSVFPLFGDAGAAIAVEYTENTKSMNFLLKSNGAGFETIIIPHGGVRNLVNVNSFDEREIESGIVRSDLNLSLNGLDVFNFSLKEVPASVKEFYLNTNSSNNDFDFFIMHQANLLINESIRKKLSFEPEKVPYSIQKYGNTSSASIPITILNSEAIKASASRKILATGFGVGLSWGVMNFDLDQAKLLPINIFDKKS